MGLFEADAYTFTRKGSIFANYQDPIKINYEDPAFFETIGILALFVQ